jgi:hypothetical protein
LEYFYYTLIILLIVSLPIIYFVYLPAKKEKLIKLAKESGMVTSRYIWFNGRFKISFKNGNVNYTPIFLNGMVGFIPTAKEAMFAISSDQIIIFKDNNLSNISVINRFAINNFIIVRFKATNITLAIETNEQAFEVTLRPYKKGVDMLSMKKFFETNYNIKKTNIDFQLK